MKTYAVLFSLILCLPFSLSSCSKQKENKKKEVVKTTTKQTKKTYSGKLLPETEYALAAKRLGKGKMVMLEVGSDSCKSCKFMGKMLQEIKEDSPKFEVFFIDVSKQREAARTLKVRMIPTQIFYDKEGKEVERHIGRFKKKSALVTKLKSLGFAL